MQAKLSVDAILWRKTKSGDLDAFNKIYDHHVDALYDYGIQFTNDRDHVKDCIHDVFLDIYKYRKKLADVDNVKFYLFASLKRRIHKKIKSKEPLLSSYHNGDVIPLSSASIEETIIQSERYMENTTRLSSALTNLSQRQRRGVHLKFDEEKSYEEIATILNISIESVRTLIYRAIKKMRNQIEF